MADMLERVKERIGAVTYTDNGNPVSLRFALEGVFGYCEIWGAGVVLRTKIWPDREEIEDTYPDGRIERHTFRNRPSPPAPSLSIVPPSTKASEAMSKHTAAPWHIDPEHPTDIIGPDGKRVASASVGEESGRTDEEMIANARLIASVHRYRKALRKIHALTLGEDEDAILLYTSAVRRHIKNAFEGSDDQDK